MKAATFQDPALVFEQRWMQEVQANAGDIIYVNSLFQRFTRYR